MKTSFFEHGTEQRKNDMHRLRKHQPAGQESSKSASAMQNTERMYKRTGNTPPPMGGDTSAVATGQNNIRRANRAAHHGK